MKNADGLPENFPPVQFAKYPNVMPCRTAKQSPRNLTGLYLGVQPDASSPAHSGKAVPHKSLGRGMPSRRVHTPTEARRYKKVELLRSKEEKRGFTGNPLKRKKYSNKPRMKDGSATAAAQVTPQPDEWDIPRRTPRNFTETANSGVTHLENLTAGVCTRETSPRDVHTPVVSHNTNDLLLHQVHKLSLQDQDLEGLVECYRKVCKGNIEALQALLPQRRSQPLPPSPHDKQRYSNVGFSVKSYRNPNKATIMAEFPRASDSRPKSVPVPRPLVPSPYFYKTYTPVSRRADKCSPHPGSSARHDRGLVSCLPGAGQLSRSVPSRRQHTSPSSSPLHFAAHQTEVQKLEKSSCEKTQDEHIGEILQATTKDQPFVSNSASRPKTAAGQGNSSIAASENTQQVSSSAAHHSDDDDDDDPAMAQTHSLARNASATDIMIGLEDEAGKELVVEIDEADENITKEEEVIPVVPKGRRVSITERVLKSKNSELQMAAFTVTAQYRKQQLAELLDEHAQLVSQVELMECDKVDDKENSHTSQMNGDKH